MAGPPVPSSSAKAAPSAMADSLAKAPFDSVVPAPTPMVDSLVPAILKDGGSLMALLSAMEARPTVAVPPPVMGNSALAVPPSSSTRLSILDEVFVFAHDCDDGFKPDVGMSFDSLEAVEEFYKTYAHEGGFAVRIGAQTKVLNTVENKRFVCTRQGFSKKKSTEGVVAPKVAPSGKPKKPKMRSETRCGCNTQFYVKLGPDKRYYIASMVEQHNHSLVSPDKIPFLRSNRSINQRIKTALFTCHKASICTSQAFRLLQVSDGFDNIGCMKRDLQNYYRGLRERIKDADAELFVAQMEREKEAMELGGRAQAVGGRHGAGGPLSGDGHGAVGPCTGEAAAGAGWAAGTGGGAAAALWSEVSGMWMRKG